jgi:UDP-N-acetylmuramoylalanine--D-glutamate ligase
MTEHVGENRGSRIVLVIGLARSGFAAATLLLEKGFDVRVSDASAGAGVSENRRLLESFGALVETGSHSKDFLAGVDFVVVSPGIPDDNPLIEAANEQGIEIIGELELASRYVSVPVIAVTGTNGKTTTVSLIDHCLRISGRKTVLAGNVGIPLSSVIEEAGRSDWLVLEVSSYQTARTVTFHPHVSVFLNMASDHLDRYRSFEEYFSHKRRLFDNQTPEDVAVLNHEEEIIRKVGDEISARALFFSRLGQVNEGAFLDSHTVRLRYRGSEKNVCDVSSIPLPGAHNLQNVLAAVCTLAAAGCTPEEIRGGILTFTGLPHRLEDLGSHRGIRFINDSKATNVASTCCALESFSEPIVLIMGGRHKGEPYTRLASLVAGKVTHLVVLGEAAPLIEADLSPVVAVTRAESLADALEVAVGYASPGDVVLLSPGCSSFDMFNNYEERGMAFRELVDGL